MRTGIYLQQKELFLNLPFKSGVQNLFLKSGSSQSNYSEIERLNQGRKRSCNGAPHRPK